jgi:hypothetical protein
VEFTASAELCEKLERCRQLMSHANPSGDIRVVIERALEALMVELERKRLGRAKLLRAKTAERPLMCGERSLEGEPERSNETGPSARTRNVARAVRREVYERDGAQCTYVAEGGRRCEARSFLELDHVVPRALGGSDDARNLRVRCRAHNQLAAEAAFGREVVERHRNLRRQKSVALDAKASREVRAAASEGAPSDTTRSVAADAA